MSSKELLDSFQGYREKARKWIGVYRRTFPYRVLYVYRNFGCEEMELRSSLSRAAVERRLQNVYVAKYNQLVRAVREARSHPSNLFELAFQAIQKGELLPELLLSVEKHLTAMYVWIALRLPLVEHLVYWLLHELHHKPNHPDRERLEHFVDMFYGVLPLDVVQRVLFCNCRAEPFQDTEDALLRICVLAELRQAHGPGFFAPKSRWNELLVEIKIEL